MKRLSFLLCSLLLAACGADSSLLYELDISPAGQEREADVLLASVRVIERRLEAMGEEPLDLSIKRSNPPRIGITLEESVAAEILDEQLQSEFSLEFMLESSQEEADMFHEIHGGFKESGLGKDDLVWLEAQSEVGGTGRVILNFTEEGREKVATLFAENQGKKLGFFVRETLASLLLIDTDEVRDQIIISEIPNVELAEMFADDANVGLHVTFNNISQ